MGTVSSDPTDVIKQLDYIEVEKIEEVFEICAFDLRTAEK